MPKRYGQLLAGYGEAPVRIPEAILGVNTFVHAHREIVTLASQPTTDTILLARLPAGHVWLGGLIVASASLGTSTIAIGNATTPGKYRAAAVFTAVDTPTLYGLTSAFDDNQLAADEEVLITIGTAALPASGTLVSIIFTGKP